LTSLYANWVLLTDTGGVNLQDADLQYTSLEGSDVSQTHLVNTDLSNANLSDANLYHSYLENVDLSGADLSGADLSEIDHRNDMGLTQEQIDEAAEADLVASTVESIWLRTPYGPERG
jgi:uncharacterized protein YjbI with pentapeptide repeats